MVLYYALDWEYWHILYCRGCLILDHWLYRRGTWDQEVGGCAIRGLLELHGTSSRSSCRRLDIILSRGIRFNKIIKATNVCCNSMFIDSPSDSFYYNIPNIWSISLVPALLWRFHPTFSYRNNDQFSKRKLKNIS